MPAEKASIQVRYFILHILIAGHENPTTLSEVGLADESIGLAQDFLNQHRRNMSDGVCIVALVDIQRGAEQIPLIPLIKGKTAAPEI